MDIDMDGYSIRDVNVMSDEQDSYVYLDFNGKLPVDVFKKEVFIRFANLHKNNAFVQVNDSIFKGTVDLAVGTNLFFDPVEDPLQQTDAFDRRGSKQLDYILRNTMVINLKQVKVPPKKFKLPKKMKKIEFNFNWDYNELLEKFNEGTLKGEDIIINDPKESTCGKHEELHENIYEEVNQEVHEKMDVGVHERVNEEVPGEVHEEVCGEVHEGVCVEVNEEVHEEIQKEFSGELVSFDKEIEEVENQILADEKAVYDLVPITLLEESYEKLKNMALRPMRTELSPELIEKCDSKYRAAYEYDSLQRQVIKTSDCFRREPVAEINPITLSNFVNIDRCVLYGILAKSSASPRELTEEEKQRVLTLDNFDNLSLVARFNVLKSQVDNLEKDLANKSENELVVKDDFDRTPLQTLEIYRKLRDTIKKRIDEISYSENSFVNSELSTLAGRN